MKKKKFRNVFIWMKKNESKIKAVLASALLIISISIYFLTNESVSINTFLDTTVLTTIVVLFFINSLWEFWVRSSEDDYKILNNPNMLVEQYCKSGLFEFCGNKYPIVELVRRDDMSGKTLNVVNSLKEYKPPIIAQMNYIKLMEAHSKSKVYNQNMVRVDDIRITNSEIVINTSRTNFFNSLITNRAIDVVLEGEMTIRSIFEPGPFLSDLKQSKLSNHLGINIVITTSDSKLILVNRSKYVSIGKNKYGISVGAAVKPMYFKTFNESTSVEDITNSICSEIFDELGTTIDKIDEEFSLKRNLLSIFRDLFEGGKPQLLLEISSKLSFADHQKIFNEHKHTARIKSNPVLIDGNRIIGLDIEAVKHCIEKNQDADNCSIEINNRKYQIAPSHYSVLALYLSNSPLSG